MMKFLTVSTFFGAIALVKADYPAFHFLNTIPENVPVGTKIDLEWTSQIYTGEFTLYVYAFNTTPYGYQPGPLGTQFPLYDGKEVVLAELPSAAGGTYAWNAEPVDDEGTWTGSEFLYQIDASFPGREEIAGAGAFYLM